MYLSICQASRGVSGNDTTALNRLEPSITSINGITIRLGLYNTHARLLVGLRILEPNTGLIPISLFSGPPDSVCRLFAVIARGITPLFAY